MRGAIVSARAPVVFALALVLTLLAVRSSLLRLVPVDLSAFPWSGLVLLGAFVLLLPALLARDTAFPAAGFIVVPVLAASAYGSSRLDWLRLLKDFGVSEATALDWARLGLGALALALLWALHAVDLAVRLRARAIERGIHAEQASEAAKRSLRRTLQTGAWAMAGALGLFLVALGGLALGEELPTERGAFVVPLLAAVLLAAAALWLARGQNSAR